VGGTAGDIPAVTGAGVPVRSPGDGSGGPGHVPVLLEAVLHFLSPRSGGVYVDATVGLGGHAAAILERSAPDGQLIGIDRDPSALRVAARRLQGFGRRVRLVRGDFAHLDRLLDEAGVEGIDGALFDLGVSSLQLDDPARGFSYRADAPLDMRMDPDQPTRAYHLVNGLEEEELAALIRRYGEERWARRIAAAIVRYRRRHGSVETTGQLAEIVRSAIPAAARRSGGHPARRTFQALRIAVNRELDALAAGLDRALLRLRPGGRIVVIAFHSLEDRIVKERFRQLSRPQARGAGAASPCPAAMLRVLTPRPVMPGEAEVTANPRARSARLRAAERMPTGPAGAEGQGVGHGRG
jgi:16S rRNA (cytosine1402-N4)-methyltransferase